jgi:hypothetical protein
MITEQECFMALSARRGFGMLAVFSLLFAIQSQAAESTLSPDVRAALAALGKEGWKYIRCELHGVDDHRKKQYADIQLIEAERRLIVNGTLVNNPEISDDLISWFSQDMTFFYYETIEVNRYTGAWKSYFHKDPYRSTTSQGKCEVSSKRAF